MCRSFKGMRMGSKDVLTHWTRQPSHQEGMIRSALRGYEDGKKHSRENFEEIMEPAGPAG